jgi:hypothetical protein
VAWWVQIETLAGEWKRVSELEERARRATRINSGRAGITTVRALLFCAAARVRLDDSGGAARLARTAISFGDDGDPRVNAPWLRLAIARHDLPEIRRLFAANHKDLPPYAGWWALDNEATRLDALAALDETDQPAAEATTYQVTDPYLAAVAGAP